MKALICLTLVFSMTSSLALALPADSKGSDTAVARPKQSTQKDLVDFWSELAQGKKYEEQGDIEKAILAYTRADQLATARAHYLHLIWAWERILKHKPLDPTGHLALSSVFLRSPNPRLVDAELHCKRAISLSKDKRNPEAEKILAVIQGRKARSNHSSTDPKRAIQKQIDRFKTEVIESWSPPESEGLVLTRCFVFIGQDSKCVEVKIICPSGSTSVDESAFEVLKKAPYSLLKGIYVPGALDFVFATEGKNKTVDFFYFLSTSPSGKPSS